MSSISVRLPTVMRAQADGETVVSVTGESVGAVLQDLVSEYPGLKENLLDDEGSVRKFVNVYVNDEDIRFLEKLDTPVEATDEVTILPAVAGG